MGLSLALGISAVVGGIATVSAANKGAKAAKNAASQQNALAKQQMDYQNQQLAMLQGASSDYGAKADELLGDSRNTIEDSYKRIIGLINNIPKVDQLFPKGEELSRKDFDFRTGIKRENLDFILGDTQSTLRDIQSFSANLANLDEGAFTGKFNKIIRSNMLGLKALTVGEPTGSFANLSARNLYDFSNKALSNYLQVNDFFAKEGTVDPISPYTISQDLFANEFNIAGQRIGNERWRGEQLVGINNAALGVAGNQFSQAGQIAQLGMGIGQQYYGTLSSNAGIDAAAQAQQSQGIAQAIGLITQGLGSAAGMYQQNQALGLQKSYYNQLLGQLNVNSLSNYAPKYTSSTKSPSFYNPVSSPSSSGSFNEPILPLTNGTIDPTLFSE